MDAFYHSIPKRLVPWHVPVSLQWHTPWSICVPGEPEHEHSSRVTSDPTIRASFVFLSSAHHFRSKAKLLWEIPEYGVECVSEYSNFLPSAYRIFLGRSTSVTSDLCECSINQSAYKPSLNINLRRNHQLSFCQ